MKVLNKATTLPLSHIQTKLNDHLEAMNKEGWELMNAAIEAVGIEELIVCFWRKELGDSPLVLSNPTEPIDLSTKVIS